MNTSKITIKQLIDQAQHELIAAEYSDFTLKAINNAWRLFSDYAAEQGQVYYSTELFLLHVEERYQALSIENRSFYKTQKYKYMCKLDEFYKFGHIMPRSRVKKIYCFDGCMEESVAAFLMEKAKVLSASRYQAFELYLERFCFYIASNTAITGVDELSGDIIVGFFEACVIYTEATIYATVSCLGQYLDFLYEKKYIPFMLSTVLPRMPRRDQKEILSVYSSEDIQTLLTCFDLNNKKDKRDYAMILIAARLGLRASDICHLKFGEVHWVTNEISIIQQKTKQPATYPLLNDVGEAIISYIKDAHPQVDSEYIFLRTSPPYRELANGGMYNLTAKYFTRAGIKVQNRRCGPHSLRHTLSSLLLNADIPLPVISEILAHKSTETTKVYLSIAAKQLAECALSVPPIEREGADV